MKGLKIAIVGATGLVGQTILNILDEEDLITNNSITLYVSSRSAGKEYLYKGLVFRLLKLDENAIDKKFDIVFFSAGSEVSKIWAEKFAKSGAFVIDNTSAFRKRFDVPLVVPEINSYLLNKDTKLISNPNCSTIELAVVIDRLKAVSKIKKIIVSTYQSVSGAGRRALCDLYNQTKNVFRNGINDNIVAQIGDIQDNGYSDEENKIMFELCKILNEKFTVLATAIRVPISVCHGESVYVEFEDCVDVQDLNYAMNCEYIKISNGDIIYPSEVKNTNLTYVCRLRKSSKTEIQFFLFADNLRRGAAYNAVKIAKFLINNFI